MARFSIAASLLGWAVASFFTTLLVGLSLAASVATSGDALVAMGVSFGAILVGFAIGGYAAGRLGPAHGVLHGAAIVGWTALFTGLGVALTSMTADSSFSAMLSPFLINWSLLDPRAALGLGFVALLMLAGGCAGAEAGAAHASGRGMRLPLPKGVGRRA